MTHPAQQLNQWSLWAETNPAKCPCRGGGWLLSDFDTWHRCGLHADGVPHPEDDEAQEHWTREDSERRHLGLLRTAYATFRDASGMEPDAFREAAAAELETAEPSAQDWVNAAEAVASRVCYEAEEADARRRGYSCGLEARLADDAAREAFERGAYC